MYKCSKNEYSLKGWRIFLWCIVAYIFFGIGHSYIWPLNKFLQLLQGLSALFVILFLIRLPKRKIKNGIASFLYICVAFFSLLTILRWPFTPMIIPAKFLLQDSAYLFAYLLPLLFLIKIGIKEIAVFFHLQFLFIGFGIFYNLYNFTDLYQNAVYIYHSADGSEIFTLFGKATVALGLLIPLTFFCFYFKFWRKDLRVAFIIAFLLALMSSLLMGRRTNSVIPLGIIVLQFFYLNFIEKKGFLRLRNIFTVIIIVTVIFVIIPYNKLETSLGDTFTVLYERIDQDNRSGTEKDFYKDMSSFDILIGRGINGHYRSPEVADIDKLHRNVIETGYLNIILHGGLFLLIPYVLLMLNSAYKGFFKTKNRFTKYSSLYIIYNILLLYPSGIPALNFSFILLWICMNVCQSKYFRSIPEDYIIKELQFNKINL